MKKGVIIITSVFDFLLAVLLVLSSIPCFAAYIEVIKSFNQEGAAILILLFFIFIVILVLVATMLIAGLICLGFAALNVAAGVKKLMGFKSGNQKTVKRFALATLIINTATAFVANACAIDALRNMQTQLGFNTVVVLLLAVVSTANAILNAVCYGDAKYCK